MSIDASKLQGILDRTRHLIVYQNWMATPFNLNGRLVATDGYALIAFKTKEGSPYQGSQKNADYIEKLLEPKLGKLCNPLDLLRDIGIDHPAKIRCDRCHGTATIDCPKCEGTGKIRGRECGECKGSGDAKCSCGNCSIWGLNIVWIDGIPFDRAVIGTWLGAVTDDRFRCTVPDEAKPFTIGGKEWRLVFMPMRPCLILEERLKAAPKIWITKTPETTAATKGGLKW